MLDVGFSEILLTSAIALIVLGPERLPKVARQVGNWMGRARAMARQLTEQLEREVNEVDALNKQVNSLNVDNMLKAPIKPVPNNPYNPQSIAAPDHAHTPSFSAAAGWCGTCRCDAARCAAWRSAARYACSGACRKSA